MAFYCIKCTTGKEDPVSSEVQKQLREYDSGAVVCFPKKVMFEKHRKQLLEVEKALIPGYIIVSTEIETEKLATLIYDVKGAYYLLRYSNTADSAYVLRGADADYALWVFMNNGIIKPSRVEFVPGAPIKIIDGPMKGMNGKILDVSRRGHKARVEIPFMGNNFQVTLAIDYLKKV